MDYLFQMRQVPQEISGGRADPLAMDGFAEANLLLSSALEQLDDLIINADAHDFSFVFEQSFVPEIVV
ncbi:hypothetical protein ANCDUO_00078 [Ancylostoma duodenale]|uniref:Uncharacterized protein n=1 Tax=Ancylostoma duodenale TaxID=51022 RepID=A0A0C2DHY9_9BILA|nr:hypothetical protein ANCDUO_00078 [Ancylostoma duodenale]